MKRWIKIVPIVSIVVTVLATVGAVKMYGPRAVLSPRARPLTSRTFEHPDQAGTRQIFSRGGADL